MGDSAELCGYTTEHEGRFTPNDIRCCREVWKDGRCIWHADEADKPVDKLREARKDGPKRLDGAILRDTDFWDAISFRGCTLAEANLADADLTNANLEDADLTNANLEDADLKYADLTHAHLSGAVLTDADLQGVDLQDADLQDADLQDADLQDADLTNAYLLDAELTDAYLRETDLTHAHLLGADLTNADLENAYLTDANLINADLTHVFLSSADLTDANFGRTDLTEATLEQANLTRANLFGADLTGAELYGAVLTDIQFGKKTEFGKHYADKLTPENVPEDGSDLSAWDKARWTNRQLERLARENALPEQARDAFKRRKDLRRREHWHRAPIPGPVRTLAETAKRALGSPRRWFRDRFSDHPVGHLWNWSRTASSGLLMRYGESPGRVVGVSGVFILIWTLLYPIPGIRETPSSQSLTYADVFASDLPNALDVLGTHLYFSTVTFTTLGYGDFQPVGWARWLATVESFFGALLMALLVFVLGRRATW